MPFRTPIVAGMPPLTRTTDSRWEARATFSGYGKPGTVSRDPSADRACTMSVDRGFQGYYWFAGLEGALDLFGNI